MPLQAFRHSSAPTKSRRSNRAPAPSERPPLPTVCNPPVSQSRSNSRLRYDARGRSISKGQTELEATTKNELNVSVYPQSQVFDKEQPSEIPEMSPPLAVASFDRQTASDPHLSTPPVSSAVDVPLSFSPSSRPNPTSAAPTAISHSSCTSKLLPTQRPIPVVTPFVLHACSPTPPASLVTSKKRRSLPRSSLGHVVMSQDCEKQTYSEQSLKYPKTSEDRGTLLNKHVKQSQKHISNSMLKNTKKPTNLMTFLQPPTKSISEPSEHILPPVQPPSTENAPLSGVSPTRLSSLADAAVAMSLTHDAPSDPQNLKRSHSSGSAKLALENTSDKASAVVSFTCSKFDTIGASSKRELLASQGACANGGPIEQFRQSALSHGNRSSRVRSRGQRSSGRGTGRGRPARGGAPLQIPALSDESLVGGPSGSSNKPIGTSSNTTPNAVANTSAKMSEAFYNVTPSNHCDKVSSVVAAAEGTDKGRLFKDHPSIDHVSRPHTTIASSNRSDLNLLSTGLSMRYQGKKNLPNGGFSSENLPHKNLHQSDNSRPKILQSKSSVAKLLLPGDGALTPELNRTIKSSASDPTSSTPYVSKTTEQNRLNLPRVISESSDLSVDNLPARKRIQKVFLERERKKSLEQTKRNRNILKIRKKLTSEKTTKNETGSKLVFCESAEKKSNMEIMDIERQRTNEDKVKNSCRNESPPNAGNVINDDQCNFDNIGDSENCEFSKSGKNKNIFDATSRDFRTICPKAHPNPSDSDHSHFQRGVEKSVRPRLQDARILSKIRNLSDNGVKQARIQSDIQLESQSSDDSNSKCGMTHRPVGTNMRKGPSMVQNLNTGDVKNEDSWSAGIASQDTSKDDFGMAGTSEHKNENTKTLLSFGDIAQSRNIFWAKVRGFPFWPAQHVSGFTDLPLNMHFRKAEYGRRKDTDTCVMFFGSSEVAFVKRECDIVPWVEGVSRTFHRNKRHGKAFQKAIRQACVACARPTPIFPRDWWCAPPALDWWDHLGLIMRTRDESLADVHVSGDVDNDDDESELDEVSEDSAQEADSAFGRAAAEGIFCIFRNGVPAVVQRLPSSLSFAGTHLEKPVASALCQVRDGFVLCIEFGCGDICVENEDSLVPLQAGVSNVIRVAAQMSGEQALPLKISAGEAWGYVQQPRVWPSGHLSGRPWWNFQEGAQTISIASSDKDEESNDCSPSSIGTGKKALSLWTDGLLGTIMHYEHIDNNVYPELEEIRSEKNSLDGQLRDEDGKDEYGEPTSVGTGEMTKCECGDKRRVGDAEFCLDERCSNWQRRYFCSWDNCTNRCCRNRPFASRKRLLTAPIVLKSSRDKFLDHRKKWALRCDEDGEAGAFIGEFVGDVVSLEKFTKRLCRACVKDEGPYAWRLNSGFVVDARYRGNFTRFLHGSCIPNCCIQLWVDQYTLKQYLGVFLIKSIQKGAILTVAHRFADAGMTGESLWCSCSPRSTARRFLNPVEIAWARERVGRRIRVKWDSGWYNGVVARYNERLKKFDILYEDGDKESLSLGFPLGNDDGTEFVWLS